MIYVKGKRRICINLGAGSSSKARIRKSFFHHLRDFEKGLLYTQSK
jgi:hypothetical protein